ncbi:MAG: hypothetical protein R3B72_11595 [Polyangiaceae bacterium]
MATTRWLVGFAALVGMTLGMSTPAHAKKNHPEVPYLVGDVDEGEYVSRLHRGAVVPDELLVMPTGDNCQSYVDAKVSWNKQENWVKLHLVGDNALTPHPTVERTEGVDYFPNPFMPEPEDFTNGRYQFWFIILGEPIDFYYDPLTLDLLGSEHDFNTPPVGVITLHLPVGYAMASNFFQPDQNGDLDYQETFAYDAMVRGDLPQFAHVAATYIPHNLCTAHPFRYEQTTTRPYSVTRPAAEALTFEDYLRSGMFFDLTIEPPQYASFPPRSTNAATFSQNPAVGGGIPNGWSLDIEAVFANLAPPIRPWEGAGACQPWLKPQRIRSFNQCIPM